MFIYCICTQYLVGAPFALITASIRRGMEVISCGTAEVVWKPRLHNASDVVSGSEVAW